jgi:hypothetical protein
MKYVGNLNKGITRKRMGIFADDADYATEAQRTTDEMFSKLPDLFAVHQVSEGDWAGLAMALAKTHVPGFKLINPAGRKTEWNPADKAEFRLDVDAIIENHGISVVEAIKLACRLDAWIEKTKEPMTIAALEQHYYKADIRFIQVVKDARAWQSHLLDEKSHESIVSTN